MVWDHASAAVVDFGPPGDDEVAAQPLTPEARALLARADAGGVPMFASAALLRIAGENGVEVTPEMTPNEIIDKLRERR